MMKKNESEKNNKMEKKQLEETNLTNSTTKFAEKKMREQKKNIAANK